MTKRITKKPRKKTTRKVAPKNMSLLEETIKGNLRDDLRKLRNDRTKLEIRKMRLAKIDDVYDNLDDDWNSYTVWVEDNCYAWIPSYHKTEVLLGWCKRNLAKGSYREIKKQEWTFKNKKDAKVFEMAWNVRYSINDT